LITVAFSKLSFAGCASAEVAVALAPPFPYASLDAVLGAAQESGEPPLLVALDGVTDPHNLGAVCRSAEGAGATGVVVVEHNAARVTAAVCKASAGAVEHVPVAVVVNLARYLEEIKRPDLWVWAAAEDAETPVWSADFKGEFRTLDGFYCYPLTISDGCSRFLLCCQALDSTAHEFVKPVFVRTFKEYGLPKIIRTDNGTPFATTALLRLSRLSAWWIRLGIYPELTQPGHPGQNGRHERMHRPLKAETTRPAARSKVGQQRRFNPVRSEYRIEPPLNAWEQAHRQDSPEERTAHLHMSTYGPDLNLSTSQ
jgi:transposase InsO family protein